jgi:hypothetical protein
MSRFGFSTKGTKDTDLYNIYDLALGEFADPVRTGLSVNAALEITQELNARAVLAALEIERCERPALTREICEELGVVKFT